MFEYCKYYPCVYDESGFCRFLKKPCKREIKEARCIHTGLYLKCPYAFYHNGILGCGCDTDNTERYVPGLPKHKYREKLAVDDLPSCLKEIRRNKSRKKKPQPIEEEYTDEQDN